jgi:hypothetical protein
MLHILADKIDFENVQLLPLNCQASSFYIFLLDGYTRYIAISISESSYLRWHKEHAALSISLFSFSLSLFYFCSLSLSLYHKEESRVCLAVSAYTSHIMAGLPDNLPLWRFVFQSASWREASKTFTFKYLEGAELITVAEERTLMATPLPRVEMLLLAMMYVQTLDDGLKWRSLSDRIKSLSTW